MAELVVGIFVAAFGLIIGSFLNVCIYRVPRHLSIVWPASRCPSCGHELSWMENVPVVSYVALGGRCRACRGPISWQYPLVEIVTGGMIVGLYWWYGPTTMFVVRAIFACAMLVLFVIDLQLRILPNTITLPGIGVGFVLSSIAGPGWLDSLIGIAVGGGVLFGLGEAYFRIRGEEGLGMGDVKMLAMVGAFLGWKLALVTLVLSSLVGSVFGVGLMIVRREGLKYALPFGTFLAVAALASAVAGDELLAWYLGFYQVR